MNCLFCDKKLRKDNTIGTCRAHRNSSPKRLAYYASWKSQNIAELASYKKQYAEANKEKSNTSRKNRYHEDINFKLGISLRNRINKIVSGKLKPETVINALGCTLEEFKTYLESQFSNGMTWKNHSTKGWHIDHIKPLVMFDLTNAEQFKVACHYTNLRPLWATENLSRPKYTRI